METQTREIIDDIINQAKNGVINIGEKEKGVWRFFVRFYTQIEEKLNHKAFGYPVLNIPNYNLFVFQIDKYLTLAEKFYEKDKTYFDLSETEFKKKLFLDLIVNAGNYDFANFYQYIEKRMYMLSENQNLGTIQLGMYLDLKISANISKNHSNLESPYIFDIYFTDEFGNEFKLPSILFSITQDNCNIFAIQNLNKSKDNPLSKKLDRFFRKVNKGIDMEDFLGNITPNALVSLTIFNSYLKQKNINEISAPVFLPLRYHANKIRGYKKASDSNERHDFLKKLNYNQHNITEKFMYLFLRYEFHFDNTKTCYDDAKQQLQLRIGKNNPTSTDNIIHDISKAITIKEKEKQ